ncbi:MAG: NAD-dependent DNA ligase LigA [Fibrobacterota bacterium]
MSRERLKELYKRIAEYDRAYYVYGESKISDREYDALYKEMEELEKAYPDAVRPDSPTRRVGSDLSGGFEKYEHRTPMLSISNTYSPDELRAALTKLVEQKDARFTAELKMDGIACALHYEEGRFIRAVTRGNGRTGDVITANAKTIRSIPMEIDYRGSLEVRGEILMSFKAFERLNAQRREAGEPPLQNPRNTTAGTIKQISPRKTARRGLHFFAYSLLSDDPAHGQAHSGNLAALTELGFSAVEHSDVLPRVEEVLAFCRTWEERRLSYAFPVDGMVIKVDQIPLYEDLGSTAKSPRWVIAYKFEPEQAETEILRIDAQVGRTGVITPVARLAPVSLAGTTVRNATLHNYEEIARLGVNIGDTVCVEKSGEIIPKIMKVVTRRSDAPFAPPTTCPECGSRAEKPTGEVALRCPNPQCPAQIFAALSHFVSLNAMNIAGMGPAIIRELLAKDLIATPADIYTLTYEDLIPLERMGEKSVNNLLAAIDASRSAGLARVLNALGIPHVGLQTARILADHFGSIDALMTAQPDDLESLESIGPELAESISSFFQRDAVRNLIEQLRTADVTLSEEQNTPAGDRPLKGKRFVLTGSLSTMTRREAKNRLESLGASVTSSISTKTDGLICGENPGSKRQKADDAGVPIYGEDFFDKFNTLR